MGKIVIAYKEAVSILWAFGAFYVLMHLFCSPYSLFESSGACFENRKNPFGSNDVIDPEFINKCFEMFDTIDYIMTFRWLLSVPQILPFIAMFVEFDTMDIIKGFGRTRPPDISGIIQPRVKHLRVRINKVIAETVAICNHLKYEMVPRKLPVNEPQLYPVDKFVKRLFTMFYPERVAEAFAKYKRVNPTFPLKCKFLQKFNRPGYSLTPEATARVPHAVKSVYDSIRNEKKTYSIFLKELAVQIDNLDDFELQDIDGSKAAGFPYATGVKKFDAYDDAKRVAVECVRDERKFDEYMAHHQWYTGGRAKLVPIENEDSARMIEYAGLTFCLLGNKFSRPFVDMCVAQQECSFSAVGMTWTHNGADKLAAKLELVEGFAPSGHNVVSTDIGNFDGSCDKIFFESQLDQELSMIDEAPVTDPRKRERYKRIWSALRRDMVNARVLLPGGHQFTTQCGMKSGWLLTSLDDCIIQEAVWRLFDDKVSALVANDVGVLQRKRRKVYGDDFIGIIDKRVGDDMIRAHFLEYGFVIKYVHSSTQSCNVDFLSKYLYYSQAVKHYYPYRPLVETVSRILMPEEYDVARRSAPDPIIAAERLIGHVFDNPYNLESRAMCLKMLSYLHEHYHIEDVDMEKVFEKFRMRGIVITIRRMPCVPSEAMIDMLYGIDSTKLHLQYDDAIRQVTPVPQYDITMLDSVDTAALSAESYADLVSVLKGKTVGSMKNLRIKQLTRYFTIPSWSTGNAGLKFLEIIKMVGKPKSVYEIGSHPGAVAEMARICDIEISGVSLYPIEDQKTDRPFMYKLDERLRERFKQDDWRNVKFDDVDMVYNDSYSMSQTTDSLDDVHRYVEDMIVQSHEVMTKVRKDSPKCVTYVTKVHGFTPKVYAELYAMMREFGEMRLIKPVYSYPWQSEVYAVFERNGSKQVRKSSFFHAINSFRNRLSARLLAWATLRSQNLTRHLMGRRVIQCPAQGDVDFQQQLIDTVKPEWFKVVSTGFEGQVR